MNLASRLIALGALALSGCVAYVDTSALVQPQPGIRLPDNTTVVGGWLAENHTIVTEDGVALYAAMGVARSGRTQNFAHQHAVIDRKNKLRQIMRG